MKVFLSVDMEGICGITSARQTNSQNPEYAQARLWMTDDVNAAVAGALEGGATEVIVRDAHGPATNIPPDRLHPSARLMAGWTPVLDMMQGLDESFGVAFLIGYHPGPPAAGGVLTHTYNVEAIREVRINGISAGETLINAVQAGSYGVPVGLVTGERALHDEIREVLPGSEFVETKVGFGYQSALLEPMEACRGKIREAAARVVRETRAGRPRPVYRPALPIRARIDFHRAEPCLAARSVPGVEAVDSRSVDLLAGSADEFIRRFLLLMQVFYGMRSA